MQNIIKLAGITTFSLTATYAVGTGVLIVAAAANTNGIIINAAFCDTEDIGDSVMRAYLNIGGSQLIIVGAQKGGFDRLQNPVYLPPNYNLEYYTKRVCGLYMSYTIL